MKYLLIINHSYQTYTFAEEKLRKLVRNIFAARATKVIRFGILVKDIFVIKVIRFGIFVRDIFAGKGYKVYEKENANEV